MQATGSDPVKKLRSDQTIQLRQILRVFKQCWFWYFVKWRNQVFFLIVTRNWYFLFYSYSRILWASPGLLRLSAWKILNLPWLFPWAMGQYQAGEYFQLLILVSISGVIYWLFNISVTTEADPGPQLPVYRSYGFSVLISQLMFNIE